MPEQAPARRVLEREVERRVCSPQAKGRYGTQTCLKALTAPQLWCGVCLAKAALVAVPVPALAPEPEQAKCLDCGELMVCPKARAEELESLQQMNDDLLERAEQAEAENATLRASLAERDQLKSAVHRLDGENAALRAELARLRALAVKWRERSNEKHGSYHKHSERAIQAMRQCADELEAARAEGQPMTERGGTGEAGGGER